jgi:hypothetical protein
LLHVVHAAAGAHTLPRLPGAQHPLTQPELLVQASAHTPPEPKFVQ